MRGLLDSVTPVGTRGHRRRPWPATSRLVLRFLSPLRLRGFYLLSSLPLSLLPMGAQRMGAGSCLPGNSRKKREKGQVCPRQTCDLCVTCRPVSRKRAPDLQGSTQVEVALHVGGSCQLLGDAPGAKILGVRNDRKTRRSRKKPTCGHELPVTLPTQGAGREESVS